MKKIIPVLFIINTFFFIISLSLSFTILFRPFYYWQINALNLTKETGYEYPEIKEAYDDVMDYCILHKEFSTGVLKHSEDGMNHFKDCRVLFIINFIIFIISSIIMIIKHKYFKNIKLFKMNPSFWSSILIIFVFSIISLLTLIIGFDEIFTLFHKIFFLGKDNWLFDSSKDEIIKILPEQFFMNCGILIVSIISVISIIIIIKEIYMKKEKLSK